MELIAIIIIIIIAVNNGRAKAGMKKGKEASADYAQYWGKFKESIRSVETSINSFLEDGDIEAFSPKQRKKTAEQIRQQEIIAARKRELEERKKREAVEQRKRAEELRRKQEEQRKKELEEARKKKEEQEMLKKFGTATVDAERKEEESCKEICKDSCKEICDKPVPFRVEDYLDPLTASFYPGNVKTEKENGFSIDDYLFPTLAPYYPKTEVTDLFSNEQ